MSGVLILANEHVGRAMAGPAIRCFELSGALARAGHEVTLASPFESDLDRQPFALERYDQRTLPRLAAAHEVVVVQGWVLDRHPELAAAARHVVVDLYDPFPLELLMLLEAEPRPTRMLAQRDALRAVSDQAARGDFFICASEKQRDFWLGWLSALNRVNPIAHDADPTLRGLIDVVAFGVPDQPPVASGRPAMRGAIEGIGADDVVLLWGGGVYDWFDPEALVRAVAAVAGDHPRLRLVFMATGHPNPEQPPAAALARARAAADELGATGRSVFFNHGWVDYDRRSDWLLEADAGVSTHFDHVETRFAHRTRVLDYLWAGLPVLCTAGDTLADEVERHGAGLTVAPGDAEALAEAVRRLAGDRALRERCAAASRWRARELTWSAVVQPLSRWCEHPRPAPDRAAQGGSPVRPPVALTGDEPRTAVHAAARHVRALGFRSRLRRRAR